MESIDQEFSWRTLFNELKSIKPLIEVIELDNTETTMQVETLLADKLSMLPDSTQQRLKDLTYVRAGICPSYMSRDTFLNLKQELLYMSMSAKELYDTMSREIHDPIKKFKWLKIAAEKGCAEAQAFIGWCYYVGKCGCEENRMQSLYWYTKAAKQNNTEGAHMSQFLLTIYNVPPTELDAKKRFYLALDQYSKLDEKSDLIHKANLEFTLGNCYYRGYGVEKDEKQSMQYYLLAANKNNASAQLGLSWFYHHEKKDQENIKLSLNWLLHLAEKGNAGAQLYLGEFSNVASEKTKWFLLASKQEHPAAMYHLARIYCDEDKNKEAFQLFVNSAKKENLPSCFYLGQYVCDTTVNKNSWDDMCSRQEQLEWLKFAADRGLQEAQVNYGVYLENQRKYGEALDWYAKAANRGNMFAYNCLGICYANGWGVKVNMSQAMELFTLAANLNLPAAHYSLGAQYYNGYMDNDNKFVMDKQKGLMWIQKAAKLGFAKAINCLKENQDL